MAVLALDDEGHAYLVKLFRYAVGKECVEAVRGMIDEGETEEGPRVVNCARSWG